MNTVRGFDVSDWALYKHLGAQAKAVIDNRESTGIDTFMDGMADAIYLACTPDTRILPDDLDRLESAKVELYINTHINKAVKAMRATPPLLLLASLYHLMVTKKFIPLLDQYGDSAEYVTEFVEDFDSRARNHDELRDMYIETMNMVETLTSTDSADAKTKWKFKKFKREVEHLLPSTYNDSMYSELDDMVTNASKLIRKYGLDVNVDSVMLLLALIIPFRYDRYDVLKEYVIASEFSPLVRNRTMILQAIKAMDLSNTDTIKNDTIDLVKTLILPLPTVQYMVGSLAITEIATKKVKVKDAIKSATSRIVELFGNKDKPLDTILPRLYTEEYSILLTALEVDLHRLHTGRLKLIGKMHNGKLTVMRMMRGLGKNKKG